MTMAVKNNGSLKVKKLFLLPLLFFCNFLLNKCSFAGVADYVMLTGQTHIEIIISYCNSSLLIMQKYKRELIRYLGVL